MNKHTRLKRRAPRKIKRRVPRKIKRRVPRKKSKLSFRYITLSTKAIDRLYNQIDAPIDKWDELVDTLKMTSLKKKGNATLSKPAVLDNFMKEREIDSLGSEGSSMWAITGNTFRPCQAATETLTAGEYVVEDHPAMGIVFNLRESKFDSLLRFPDSDSDYVLNNISHFWASEDKFREFNFIWKRGVLLFGPPGSGKTSTVQLLAQDVIARNGCVFYVTSPSLAAVGLYMFRQIEPDRPAVVILEDIDAIIERYGEPEILALLDGELQIDNVVFVATTNYPQKLDQRIINRPSRFDIVKRIGLPNIEARKVYIEAKHLGLNGDKAAINMWAEKTDKLSIAHIKELIILVEVFGRTFEDALNHIKNLKKVLDEGEYETGGNYL